MKKIVALFTIFFSLFIILTSTTTNASEKELGYKKNKFIIKLDKNKKYDSKLKGNIESSLNNKVEKANKIEIGKSVFYSIELDNSFSNYSKIKKVAKVAGIANVQPVYIYQTLSEGGLDDVDTMPSNWHVGYTRAQQIKDLIVSNGIKRHVKVGVLDTGVDKSHPDLSSVVDTNLSRGFVGNSSVYSDDIGHGTHVAGLIGATNNYSTGTNVDIVSLRVLQYGFGDSEGIAKAIDYAQDNNIPILNMSLGMESESQNIAKDDLMFTALQNYRGLVIAAAGNSGLYGVDYPAGYDLDNIVSVASLDENGNPSNFTSYHKTKVDIFAPGTLLYSTCIFSLNDCKDNFNSEHSLATMSGTSMATPVVTGIMANMLVTNPNLTTSELKDALIDSATISNKFTNKALTNGYIDAQEVYDYAINKKRVDINSFATIQEDGSIDLWGNNDYGQLGNGNTNNLLEVEKFNFTLPEGKITKYYITSKNIYLISDQGDLYVSGDNSFGQLGQTNNNNSLEFVKFEKVEDSHKVESLSFRGKYGRYDEKSLKIELKGSKSYYKIGNESFVAKKDTKAYSDKLQYVTHNDKGYIKRITFYNKNSRTSSKYEARTYEKIYYFTEDFYEDDFALELDFDEEKTPYTYRLNKKIIKESFKTYYLKDELYYLYNNGYVDYGYCNDYGKRKVSKYSNKDKILKKTTYNYRLNCRYNYDEEEYLANKTLKNKEIINYKNTKKNNGYYYKYNYNGKLVGTKSNYATKQKRTYNSKGKLKLSKIAHYNKAGKLSKYRTEYSRKEVKGKLISIKTYKYNYSFKKLTHTNKTYKNSKKKSYLVLKYKNNIKKSGSKLVYNSKGQLKGKTGDYARKYLIKYNKKGVLASRKVAHYNKNGIRSKYKMEYQKYQTKKGYNIKKTTFKYKMIKKTTKLNKYENNKVVKKYLYNYNKFGKLKGSQAVLKIREYKNNKLFKITYYLYDKNGNKYLAYYRYV